MKRVPEIAAIAAAIIIGEPTGMAWWQIVLLWVPLDLMTATKGQIFGVRKELRK